MPIGQRCSTWPKCAVQPLVDEFGKRNIFVERLKIMQKITPGYDNRLIEAEKQQDLALEMIDREACRECPNRTLEP